MSYCQISFHRFPLFLLFPGILVLDEEPSQTDKNGQNLSIFHRPHTNAPYRTRPNRRAIGQGITVIMAKSSSSAPAASSPSDYLINLVWIGAVLYGIGIFLSNAYAIRLQAINEFGPVIHEFDPYFNWRATQVCDSLIYKR